MRPDFVSDLVDEPTPHNPIGPDLPGTEDDLGDMIVRTIVGGLVTLLIGGAVYWLSIPRVARYSTWQAAAEGGLAKPELLPSWVPVSARHIVHGWHVTRDQEEHWFVFAAPTREVHFPQYMTRLTFAQAVVVCPTPPAAMHEWLFNLPSAIDTASFFALRDGTSHTVVIAGNPRPGSDTTTFYVARCPAA